MKHPWRPTPRPKRPSGVNWTIVISTIALVLSTLQLLVTAPIITRFYYKPQVVLSFDPPKSSSDPHVFILSNQGRAPATKVEVGLWVEARATVRMSPNIPTSVARFEREGRTEDVRLEFERLLPKEKVAIAVDPPYQSELPHRPITLYLRSAEGPGEFQRGLFPYLKLENQLDRK